MKKLVLFLLLSLVLSLSACAAQDSAAPDPDDESGPVDVSSARYDNATIIDVPSPFWEAMRRALEEAGVADKQPDPLQCVRWEYYACGTTTTGEIMVCRYCVCIWWDGEAICDSGY